MLQFNKLPPKELFQRNTSSKHLNDPERVELPGESLSVFEETQPFDQVWLWTLLGLETAAVLLALILTSQPLFVLLVAAVGMVLTMSLMASFRLTTRIDDVGIHYRMKPFHWKEKTIPWEDIEVAYVRKYSPILEYGGWGMRYGRSGTAFSVKGSQGIQIVKKGGKKILIGTQMEEEAALCLNKHSITV